MPCPNVFICPLCGLPLAQVGATVRCPNTHTFDIAREGYVNLLMKKLPGDSKEMLVARRNFLAGDYYRPLSDLINSQVVSFIQQGEDADSRAVTILDAGCGEGYYLGRLQQHLLEQGYQVQAVGLDIAKEGVRMAARKHRAACFLVANLKERLPLAEQSFTLLLNIFSPRNVPEFARILAPNGLLLVVIPAPEHLRQVREALPLLSIEENKLQHVIEQYTPFFDLQSSTKLTYRLRLKKDILLQLVTMTPSNRHMSDALREALDRIEELETDVAFHCLLFRKR